MATLFIASGFVLSTTACPPPEKADPGPPKPPEQPPAPKVQDFAFDGMEEIKLTEANGGVVFTPEGFGLVAMMRVTPKRKGLNLAKQRRFASRAKGAKKLDEVKVLVTLLWDEARKKANAGKTASTEEAKQQAFAEAKTLRAEARDAMRAVHTEMAEQIDDAMLRMLFTAELWLDDTDGAAKAGIDLTTRFADSPHTKAISPWIAFLHLTKWQTAEAAKITDAWKLGDEDTDYLRAYPMAWVAFRQRDYAKAREAMVFAAKNWKSTGTAKAAERDLLLMLTRGGTPVEELATLFAEMSGGNAEQQYVWLYQAYQGYELSGYPVHAATALEQALGVLGEKVPPNDRVAIRQRQSNSYLVALDLDKTVESLIAAYKAVAPCADKCAGKDAEIATQVAKLAPHLHTIYATTQDPAYYAASKKLYDFYLTLGRPDQETLRGFLGRLEETKQRAPAGTGKHDEATMKWSSGLRKQEVKACYEEVLQGEPTLTGSLEVTLSIEHTGNVVGVETDPAQGEAGMAAVGGCIQKRAQGWTFPSRSIPGKTAVVRSFALAPRS